MNQELAFLTITAASIGFFHTLIGPDHYIPFIMMAKARKWPMLKTILITFFSGIGHVGSSVVLGILGIILGLAVRKLEIVESVRGNIAAWMLIAFGFTYGLWGLHRALKNKPHEHIHIHEDGTPHVHTHTHAEEHLHPHGEEGNANITPWIIFTIFVFGPCEPLIPILMYPAARNSFTGMLFVAGVFALATIGTMLAIVVLSLYGLNFLPFRKLERYSHAIAGATILLCGLGIQFLGL